jgi:hypothetical protein
MEYWPNFYIKDKLIIKIKKRNQHTWNSIGSIVALGGSIGGGRAGGTTCSCNGWERKRKW